MAYTRIEHRRLPHTDGKVPLRRRGGPGSGGTGKSKMAKATQAKSSKGTKKPIANLSTLKKNMEEKLKNVPTANLKAGLPYRD